MKSILQYHSSSRDLSFVVKEYYQPHFTSPFHFHDSYELIHIVKSFGKLYAGNRIVNFNAGDIYLFGPGFKHCFYNDKSFISSGETAQATVIFFKESFLGEHFFQKPELSKIKYLLNQSASGIKVNKPSHVLHSIFKQITRKKGMKTLILLITLLDLLSTQKKNKLSRIVTDQIAISKSYDLDRMESVFKYVLENFKEDINIKTASSLACFSESAFCRYFKRRTEKTFSQFVNSIRITHATQLLTESDWSIANICFECGYKNISYFNREFKTALGLTPFDYRKSFSKLVNQTESEENALGQVRNLSKIGSS